MHKHEQTYTQCGFFVASAAPIGPAESLGARDSIWNALHGVLLQRSPAFMSPDWFLVFHGSRTCHFGQLFDRVGRENMATSSTGARYDHPDEVHALFGCSTTGFIPLCQATLCAEDGALLMGLCPWTATQPGPCVPNWSLAFRDSRTCHF